MLETRKKELCVQHKFVELVGEEESWAFWTIQRKLQAQALVPVDKLSLCVCVCVCVCVREREILLLFFISISFEWHVVLTGIILWVA